ncbi:MAG: isoleucine--tRNA ligase [Dehalococcoidales bacterium]|jgi:isoleucyl-tRNA synthetase|nr:isoleucine--tRNA ligase [Dehalococcoidales bacterium]MDP7109510.1 isoleucine--tRNA ligase [Dehalococcoidales bacterium]MDP7310011.1 isoleucine--tRNA ligase [Dehalococcoidales bacterium]MDP7410030.1 isoleucine--tRNA ligase [Dehalococcoidales bacterium]MDP7676057.1 isoleucine--tRNA ligase [Dehalococcoidales bacterium]
MFQPVNSKVSFPQLEEKLLRFWQEKSIFQRSVDQRRGMSRFTLYEGPPTANGNPGIHHALARVFKDVIPRYKAMKGYYAPRIAGWDTHGLPVELEVEKELGFSGKAQIEAYGVDRFNARCRESVFRYLKEWKALTERIAFWVDLEHAYITMDNDYIETGWWAIKRMWDEGLVYQGYKVTPHCPRCGTSLSSHEVALGYQDDIPDPSVYVKFKVVPASLNSSDVFAHLGKLFKSSGKPAYLLAWTTTPWTLPGNTALAVAPEADYTVIEVGDEHLILADARREDTGLSDQKVVGLVKGRDLEGLYYECLYKIPIDYSKEDKKQGYRVIEGDFVSMDDGTGIVHIAPAYGEIDFEVGQKEGLPLVHTVDLRGIVKKFPTGFTPKRREEILAGSAVPIFGPGQSPITPGVGKFVKEADPLVIEDLKKRNLLYHSGVIRHTYPFCWRCGTPLLYYAKKTWYIRTTAVKDKLIAGNEEINWYPAHIKYGRFGDWLQNNVDWAFSRERYWGTPLPVWQCGSCDRYECIGSVNELAEKPGFSGLGEPLDLHRPFVDEMTFICAKPECGGSMRRVSEVIDCWFDSGNMPIAQNHYPFGDEGSLDTLIQQGKFPADYICEAVDQTRGWFYSLHAISTLLFGRPSFKNVICLGHILDVKGDKMSKAKGNVVEPWAVINKYGADPLRWYCLTGAPPGNVRRFDEKVVAEITRQFFLTLWNVYSFFVTYANIDRFTDFIGVDPTAEGEVKPAELDGWLISELNQLILNVDAALADYHPAEAGRKIESFVDELSNWYVRRSRRRFWKSENDADKLSAYTTLYQCLVTLAKLLAPFAPFLAEELYQNLVCSVFPEAPESIHLTDFPVGDKRKIDQRLSGDMRLAMRVCRLGRAARSQAGIKVRQPLAEALVKVSVSREKESLKRVLPLILDELNVKGLTAVDSLAELDKSDCVSSSEGDYAVAVSTEISTELQAEGMAREIVHRLQTIRRTAGFDIADHIITYYQGDANIKPVLTQFADYIKRETLSRELVEGVPEQGVSTERYKLEGYEIVLGVKKH